MLVRDQHIYDVTLDPRDARVVYAAGFEGNVWRSADRGLTWKRVPGYDFKWGHRVVLDPRDPHRDLRHDLRRQRLVRPGGVS